MRIVKLSDLSQKEKDEVYRQQEERRKREEELRKSALNRTNAAIGPINVNTNLKYKENSTPLMSTESLGNLKKSNNKDINYFYKKSNAFDDGYQFGDVSKTILGTLENVGTSFAQGMHGVGSGIGKGLAGGIAQVADWVGADKYANRVRKNLTEEDPVTKILRNTNEKSSSNSILSSNMQNAVQGTGNVAGMIALQSVGVPWQVTSGLSSVGSELSEAYSNKATNGEAWLSAGISAGAEIGSEYLFGGIKLPGTGKTTEKLIGGLTNKISNTTLRTLTKFGINALGEGTEEVISGIGSAIGKKLTYMSDKELKELYSSEDAFNDFISGTLTTILSNGVSNTANVIQNKTVDTTWKNAISKTIEQQELLEQKNNLVDEVSNLDKSIKKTTDENTKKQLKEELKWKNKQLEILDGNSVKKNTQELMQNGKTNKSQQTILNSNKTAQNQNIEQTNTDVKNLPIKDLTFIETARKYGLSIDENVKSIARVTNERGINAKFDSDAFTNNEQNAIWKITTDENGKINRDVIVNPNSNSNKTLQNITIHELTHDIENTETHKQIKDLILSDTSLKEDFEQAMKSLTETYYNVYDSNSQEFKMLVENEAVADILGNKLGNQEFINKLNAENRSVARKIYDWVVDKLNKLNTKMGIKNEKIFWADIKNKFETAFKEEYKGNNEKTKFSINSNFKTEYDSWNKVNREGSFVIGHTSEALKSIGLNDYDIVMDKNKILKILNKHAEMNDNLIKQIPDILENPTLILKSQTVEGRITIFSELTSTDGKPILVAMELNPDENKNNIEKIYKVASAYGKQNVKGMQKWLDNSDNILYIDRQKNRTMNWLNGLGLQLPVPKNYSSSSTNSITSTKTDVNTTTKYSMQESGNNTQKDNKGRILSKEVQERNKNSKAIDEKGNLVTVYHTTTDNTDQFNIFNPVGTPGYRFGDNVVNYYTDSKEMSGSYADGKYEMADTSKFNNIEEVKKWLSSIKDSNYGIEPTLKKGSYFITKDGNAIMVFNSEQDLIQDAKTRLERYLYQHNKEKYSDSAKKRMYEGYVNITNPFEIDAKGKNWNRIPDGVTKKGQDQLERLKVLKENNLDKIILDTFEKAYKDSLNEAHFFADAQKKYYKEDFIDGLMGSIARTGSTEQFYSYRNKQGKIEGKIAESKLDILKYKGKTLREISENYYNNKYDQILERKLSELKEKYPILKEYNYSTVDLDPLVDSQMDKNEIMKNNAGITTTNDIVKRVIEMNKNGANYDGVIMRNVVDYGGFAEDSSIPANLYVTFSSNQFKNVDNTNPTDNPDIRYSQNTGKWQEFLDKNYKNEGTGETIKDLRKNATENTLKANVEQSSVDRYNEYRKNIIKGKETEVNSLITYKNESIRNIDEKINAKIELLNSKKNQDTKVASIIKSQIENLKSQKSKIENVYNERIGKANSKVNREKIDLETRALMKESSRKILSEEISPLVQDLSKYTDKKMGILYNRETAQRNIDDIVKDKDLATSIKETIFNPVQVHQAEKTRQINELFERINSLELNKEKKYNYIPKDEIVSVKVDEATLAQLIIEKKINDTDLKKYGINDAGIKKIYNTANTFSEILEDLYNQMNEEQVKFGYSPIGKIENYFPHFTENKPDTMLGKIASYFGIDVTDQSLPTEIAGLTDTFKPGKTWNSNTQKRRTNKTDYDALTAMQKYIVGATDIIHTTEDIQKIREYSKQIRYKFSDEGMQAEIDKIINNSELTQEAKDASLEGIFNNTKNELSNYVTWLDDYANTLANKKSFADRNIEREIGRNIYNSMYGIEGKIASNTIGGNLSVSLTNFAPIFQAAGNTKWSYLVTGMIQTASNDIKGFTGNKDISFVNNSNFLTNRFGTDTINKKTVVQTISDIASIPMNAIDNFTSESIVRAKYLENLDKGMSEETALNNADKYAAKIMADRSKGALPIIFNKKNPVAKLITMFQVEPNNMLSNYLKDMPREAKNRTELVKQATKLVAASYAFNTLAMAIRGGNEVLPDPARWISYLIKSIFGKDDDEKDKAKKDLSEAVIGTIPFLSNAAGFIGMEDIGRVPISNAMPNITNIGKIFDSESDGKYKSELVLKELYKPLLYLGLPTGGAQLKKTVEGVSAVLNGGSYKTNKKGEKEIQFAVENPNAVDYAKAGLFGKYSLNDSKIYADRGYKALSAKQTKTYEDSKIPFKDYVNYVNKKLTKKEDKIDYVNSQKWSTEQKWGIYKNDVLSDNKRNDGGSQLLDAEYMINHGVSKSEYMKAFNQAQKNKIDIPTKEDFQEMKKGKLGLIEYMNYANEVKKQTSMKRASGELNDKQSLKDKDKIDILLNSNFTDEQKESIYENYILSEKDTTYKLIKKTGIDVDEYLRYSQQEFSSDKTDDGTISGKTVSGSFKKKAYEYVNSMNVTYEQRLMLLGMKYTLNNDEQTKLYNYIKTLDYSEYEMKDTFKKLKGFTVYKDGRITW